MLASFMCMTMGLITWACGLFMGSKLANMFDVAGRYVPVELCVNKHEGCALGEMCSLPAAGVASGPETWAGYVLAVMLLLLVGVFVSYVQAAYASGTSLIYVILRKKKDDENLLEWEDEALDDEPDPLPEAGGSGEDSGAETEAAGPADGDTADKDEGESSEEKDKPESES